MYDIIYQTCVLKISQHAVGQEHNAIFLLGHFEIPVGFCDHIYQAIYFARFGASLYTSVQNKLREKTANFVRVVGKPRITLSYTTFLILVPCKDSTCVQVCESVASPCVFWMEVCVYECASVSVCYCVCLFVCACHCTCLCSSSNMKICNDSNYCNRCCQFFEYCSRFDYLSSFHLNFGNHLLRKQSSLLSSLPSGCYEL